MKDAFLVSALSIVPKNAVSGWMGVFARMRLPGPLLRLVLRWYVWKYNVDLSEAAEPLESYRTFVEFFTRALKDGLRPIDPDTAAVTSPADGLIYACGTIVGDRIPQSENQHFSATELLAGRSGYEGGSYAVIYLSPRDYHRVHTAKAGRVIGYQYAPGKLWPVFPGATRRIPFLFSRNERISVTLDTDAGLLSLVMVGAFGVGRMRVVFDPIVSNAGGREVIEREVVPPMQLAAGQEIGRFEMGSTVVLLFPPGQIHWTVAPGQAVRVGERIGRANAPGNATI